MTKVERMPVEGTHAFTTTRPTHLDGITGCRRHWMGISPLRVPKTSRLARNVEQVLHGELEVGKEARFCTIYFASGQNPKGTVVH